MSGQGLVGDLPIEVRRTHYFDGQLLTAGDFARDQEYHRNLRYLHNRALGSGIVEGLTVHPSSAGIVVSAGFAIDALGREIVLTQAEDLTLDDTLLAPGVILAVTVTWSEVLDDATWLEAPVLVVEPALTVAPPALELARIRKRRRKGLLIDLSRRDGFRLRGPRPATTPARSSHG